MNKRIFLQALGMLALMLVFGLNSLAAQTNKPEEAAKTASASLEKSEFKVYGNCGMCKRRIETALKGLTGVSTASWNTSTKMLTVEFDPKAVSTKDLHAKVASVGHDTDVARAPDEVYNKLHGCCLYDRPQSN